MSALPRDQRVLRATLASRRRYQPDADHSELARQWRLARVTTAVRTFLDGQPSPTVDDRRQVLVLLLEAGPGTPSGGVPGPDQASYGLCPERTGSHDVAAVPQQRGASS